MHARMRARMHARVCACERVYVLLCTQGRAGVRADMRVRCEEAGALGERSYLWPLAGIEWGTHRYGMGYSRGTERALKGSSLRNQRTPSGFSRVLTGTHAVVTAVVTAVLRGYAQGTAP